MRRSNLIVAFAFIVVGAGVAVTVAQDGAQGTPEAGTPVDCGTPVDTLRISPVASPELEEIVETATPEITGGGTTIATAGASPDASPVAGDPCAGAQPPVE